MGCTESVPAPSTFDVPHKVHPNIEPLGVNHGAAPANHKQEIIVKEKLFSWSGDSFKIKLRDGRSLGNGLAINGKVWAFRDQMVLLDTVHNTPVAVCLRKFEVFKQTFKIYTTYPNFPGQTPSDRKLNGTALFTYARVERIPLSTKQLVFLEAGKSENPSYTIVRAGSLWPKKRTIHKNGHPAALLQGGTWEGNWNSYLITIAPGIDPCLMVCLSAICDEMDEDQ